jgi:phosphatidate cytidylyltransferase
MVAVAGGAFWAGSWILAFFISLVGIGIFWEWCGLVLKMNISKAHRVLWFIQGLIYIGFSCAIAIGNALTPQGALNLLLYLIAPVVATDIGAYFSGRTFGGPKIAPIISPSKTWSGLVGGAVAAGCIVIANRHFVEGLESSSGDFIYGAVTGVLAQSGDFFQSWMKRRAGVKDSGKLIPGHGGLFDRADGLLAPLFMTAIFIAIDLAISLLIN